MAWGWIVKVASSSTCTTEIRGSLFRAIWMRSLRIKQLHTDTTVRKGMTLP